MDKPRYGYARQFARKVLNDCKVFRPPVELKLILAQKGYEYVEVDNFLDNVDALFLRDENDGKTYAAVNANHHVHRQRFSLKSPALLFFSWTRVTSTAFSFSSRSKL